VALFYPPQKIKTMKRYSIKLEANDDSKTILVTNEDVGYNDADWNELSDEEKQEIVTGEAVVVPNEINERKEVINKLINQLKDIKTQEITTDDDEKLSEITKQNSVNHWRCKARRGIYLPLTPCKRRKLDDSLPKLSEGS
jgi:hypothetical protein